MSEDLEHDNVIRKLKKHGPRIRARIALRIPNRYRSWFDVDDVMQETYAQAFLGFQSASPKCFAAWLYRMADNNLKDLIRYCRSAKRDACRTQHFMSSNEHGFANLADILRADDTSPTCHAHRNEISQLIRRELEQLPECYRLIIDYYDLRQWPMKEVAQELGCKETVVYVRRKTGLEYLRRRLCSQSNYL